MKYSEYEDINGNPLWDGCRVKIIGILPEWWKVSELEEGGYSFIYDKYRKYWGITDNAVIHEIESLIWEGLEFEIL